MYAPKNMPAMPIRTGRFPTPRLAMADPGHRPEIPHPTPKIIAPITVLLFNVRFLFLNSPPNIGLFRSLGIRLIVIAVTRADPPSNSSSPKSFSCRKLRTISCFDMPPNANPKPKNSPPMNTKTCFSFTAIPPDFGLPVQLIFRRL